MYRYYVDIAGHFVIMHLFFFPVNVNHPTSFLDAAQQEKMREREALASGLMFSRDRLIEMMPVRTWRGEGGGGGEY